MKNKIIGVILVGIWLITLYEPSSLARISLSGLLTGYVFAFYLVTRAYGKHQKAESRFAQLKVSGPKRFNTKEFRDQTNAWASYSMQTVALFLSSMIVVVYTMLMLVSQWSFKSKPFGIMLAILAIIYLVALPLAKSLFVHTELSRCQEKAGVE